MDMTVVFLMIVKKCNAGAVCSYGVQQVSSLITREDTCTFYFFVFLFEAFSAHETIKIRSTVHIFYTYILH